MPSPKAGYSENWLVEQPAIELFGQLGYETANCYDEKFGQNGTLGRQTPHAVVLTTRLRKSLEKLNPHLGPEAVALAIEELTRDRSALSPAAANREVYRLLKDGAKVTISAEDGARTVETVKVVDWNNPRNNDLFLASQFRVSGDVYNRRADLVGFVNGLPLLFVELKASHKQLEDAYKLNLSDYRDTIPQIFWYNALVLLSNGSQTRVGTLTAEWQHFSEWKKIDAEDEKGRVSLETAIRGTCDPARLLDIVENFTVFAESAGRLLKLVAKNHQYLGVNAAFEGMRDVKSKQGRLGVFWHTQGAGKSYSMIFFSQKVLRKLPGNYTFLIVTDRIELDDQIYKTFARAGAVTEQRVQADSGDHLRQLLREDHRNIFTLIHKFQVGRGRRYPVLSERDDIIVITDEAHRTQYDTLALNMRNALPNAAFIAFTGTPLMMGQEERTREVFGDYVSIYNFRQSVEDGATVPLYYENRIPELQLTNDQFRDDLQELIEAAELDEAQEKKLEREFAREYHLITRDDRLDRIAEDIVQHFNGRGFLGKAMVVSVDKATAVRMYDKVQTSWAAEIERLQQHLPASAAAESRAEIERRLAFMRQTDMAVVVSQSQGEVAEFRKRGLEIAKHRKRMKADDLDEKFKDPSDPLRIVFLCAMWMTGFDVPSLSTIYLDKPLRNHTLMQTIARANRVFEDKNNGLIVDYVGVFRSLQKALAIYATGPAGEPPLQAKAQLVEALRQTIAETAAFCRDHGVQPDAILKARAFERIRLLEEAREAILAGGDEDRRRYLWLAGRVSTLYKAILPDAEANEFVPIRTLFGIVAEMIRSLTPAPDVSQLMNAIDGLLDRSVAAQAYVIAEDKAEYASDRRIDLSRIDFAAIRKRFDEGFKRTETERLKALLERKLAEMVALNHARADLAEKLQRLIDEYNAGSLNLELFFDKLVAFTSELDAEEKRGIAENLSEEELALFDLLTKPDIGLSDKERDDVKAAARDLLAALKREKFVLDWRKRQQTRAGVILTIEQLLDRQLPRVYTQPIWRQKCDAVYQHVYDSYFGPASSIYATPGLA